MRKKERNGPGIATFAESDDPTLASSDKGSEGVVPRAAEAKHDATEIVVATRAARRKKHRANRFTGKSFKRKVLAFKISSPKQNRA
jgi:hypothetical protein